MSALADGAALVLLPTNLLALVALGLLVGRQARRVRLVATVLFALGLVTGALAIAAAVRDPPAAIVLLAVAASAGIIVATAWQPPLSASALLAFVGGAALALNAPPQAITLADAMASQLATGLGAVIAFVVVSMLAAAARQPWHAIALRIVASWIAASAILVLALAFARAASPAEAAPIIC